MATGLRKLSLHVHVQFIHTLYKTAERAIPREVACRTAHHPPYVSPGSNHRRSGQSPPGVLTFKSGSSQYSRAFTVIDYICAIL